MAWMEQMKNLIILFNCIEKERNKITKNVYGCEEAKIKPLHDMLEAARQSTKIHLDSQTIKSMQICVSFIYFLGLNT